jgi:hypothetical protein
MHRCLFLGFLSEMKLLQLFFMFAIFFDLKYRLLEIRLALSIIVLLVTYSGSTSLSFPSINQRKSREILSTMCAESKRELFIVVTISC